MPPDKPGLYLATIAGASPLGRDATVAGSSLVSERTYCLVLEVTVDYLEMRSIPGQRRLALDRQPRHLLAGSRHRPAAVVTAGDALEGGDALAEEADF